ncbi:MAG: DNA-formamidopyrimidine glycosylase family protein [Acidimicrobiales bacterium]
MPEMIEVEAYRRLAERAVGRTIEAVRAPDAWYLKRGLSARGLRAATVGRRIAGARRVGKLLLVDLDGSGAPVLGLRFGMTGRLLLDGEPGVGRLLYTSRRDSERWDRLVLGFAEGGDLRVCDPRRLGGVELDPREPDSRSDAACLTVARLAEALARRPAPLKAALLDQSRVAGVGNLIADELLWRAGLDPRRPAGSLTSVELRRLHRHLGRTLADLSGRGGSHTGDLMEERRFGGRCPRDGTSLSRAVVGGRTTWWCPGHQR